GEFIPAGEFALLGVSGLEDLRATEATENVERAFDVLDSNMQDIYRRGAPSRATEIKLASGDIQVGDGVSININATNTSDSTDNTSFVMSTDPVVYDDGDGTKILYVAGAVVRSDRGSAVMLSEPDWLASANRTVVPFVVTYNDGDRTVLSGQGTGLLVLQRASSSLSSFTTGPDSAARVNVSVDSPRAEVWKRYFEKQGFTALDDSPGDGTVVYQFRTDEIYVPRTDIGVTLKR
ncbi:MAG: hypothetical protein ABEH77_03265, partial [Halobacteriaceae archaeon]